MSMSSSFVGGRSHSWRPSRFINGRGGMLNDTALGKRFGAKGFSEEIAGRVRIERRCPASTRQHHHWAKH